MIHVYNSLGSLYARIDNGAPIYIGANADGLKRLRRGIERSPYVTDAERSIVLDGLTIFAAQNAWLAA